MAQWFMDLALSLLWRGFDPWPRDFHMLQAPPKKKKKKIAQAAPKANYNRISGQETQIISIFKLSADSREQLKLGTTAAGPGEEGAGSRSSDGWFPQTCTGSLKGNVIKRQRNQGFGPTYFLITR